MFPALAVDVEHQLQRYREYAERLRPLVVDTISLVSGALADGKRVLVEGANAVMLDIDFGEGRSRGWPRFGWALAALWPGFGVGCTNWLSLF